MCRIQKIVRNKYSSWLFIYSKSNYNFLLKQKLRKIKDPFNEMNVNTFSIFIYNATIASLILPSFPSPQKSHLIQSIFITLPSITICITYVNLKLTATWYIWCFNKLFTCVTRSYTMRIPFCYWTTRYTRYANMINLSFKYRNTIMSPLILCCRDGGIKIKNCFDLWHFEYNVFQLIENKLSK